MVRVRVSGGTRQRPYVTGLFPACFSIGPLLIVGVLYCVGVGLGGTREGAVMADWVVNLPPVADVLETGFLFGSAGEQFRIGPYRGDFALDDTLWHETGDDGAILTGGRQGTFLKLLGEFGWVSALPPLLPGQVIGVDRVPGLPVGSLFQDTMSGDYFCVGRVNGVRQVVQIDFANPWEINGVPEEVFVQDPRLVLLVVVG